MSIATAALPMAPPLLSAQWFRIAGLRPQLDAASRSERLVVRGEVWQVLVRADGTRSLRLNAAAWSAIARCDGRHTVQRVWDIALAELGDDAPTQDELLDMLARLHAAGLMIFDRRPDFGAPAPGVADDAAAEGDPAALPAARRNTLLAWRFPLGNPDALLMRWAPRLHFVFARWALVAWAALVGVAALAAFGHAGEIAAQWRAAMATPSLLGLAALAYPLIKALHEAAHGLAARHAGARVPEWGVSLLMFMPVPYVDVSSASALPRARQRLAVAAAGIVVELGLAALALGVALTVQPGALRDAALVIFFVGALSTLAVNANPLMRFDGYHMLCDAAGLPNLAARSTRHWLDLLRRHALRLPDAAALQTAPGERPWLWAYAPAALVMRWVVSVSVVLWLASLSFALGSAAALALAWALIVKPIAAWLRWLRTAPLADAARATAGRRSAGAALVLLVPLAVLPWPDATVAQGVLWLPEHALVRAQTEGFIDEVLVADGQAVQPGEPLLRLRSPALQADHERLLGRVAALQAEQQQALRDDPARAVGAGHELASAQAELALAEQRLSQLVVQAQAAGTVAIARADDLPGRHVERGALLGHVDTGEPGLVRVAIPHEQAALIASHGGEVDVRLADAGAAPLRGHWSGQPSGGGARLPSAALGARSGGRIDTDPQDPDGLRPAQAVLLGEVKLDRPLGRRIGERVLVRFGHGTSPLAWQAARAVQQQVLRHFNPAQ